MEEKDFEKRPKKKGIIITVVILVLIALIAGGVFAYFKLVKNKPQAIFEKAISKVFEMTEKMPKNEGKVNLELTASLNSGVQYFFESFLAIPSWASTSSILSLSLVIYA